MRREAAKGDHRPARTAAGQDHFCGLDGFQRLPARYLRIPVPGDEGRDGRGGQTVRVHGQLYRRIREPLLKMAFAKKIKTVIPV